MAQPRDNTDNEDMFRQNAENVGVTGITQQEAFLQKLGKGRGFAKNDPRFDDDERDEHGKKKRKKFELAGNSDEAQLARSSGNYNVGETWEEYSANPVTQAREAYADYQQQTWAMEDSYSFWDSAWDTAYDTYDEYVAEPFQEYIVEPFNEYVAEPFNEYIAEPVSKAFDEYVAKPFDEYIAKPVGEAVDTVVEKAKEAGTAIAETFDTYVAQPAAKAWDATKEAASSVATSVSDTVSSVATSVSNGVSSAATSVSETVSSGWQSLKNFAFGESKPAETQTAETQKPAVVQNLSVPKDEAPAKLVGDQNDVKATNAPSLSSAFSNAVDGAPKLADTAPALRPAPALAPAPAPAPAL